MRGAFSFSEYHMANKVILVGNLGRDPEIHTTQSNAVVAQLSLATTRRVKNADGTFGDETEWHRIVCFAKMAEVARDYLSKGRQIYVEGRLRTRKWTDQEGRDHYTTEIIGENFQMLGRRSDYENAGAAASSDGFESAPRPAPAARPAAAPAPKPSPVPNDPLVDDDVPF